MLNQAAAHQYYEVVMNEMYHNCTSISHFTDLLGEDAAELMAVKVILFQCPQLTFFLSLTLPRLK